MELTAGIDEAGRGPLAGPVVAGAVILDPARPIEGLADSKKLTEARRDRLYDLILERALAWAVGRAEVEEIDRINILHASMLAMRRCAEALEPRPRLALVDGNRCPNLFCDTQAVVRGDSLIPEISAGSIIAKVTRDRLMRQLDRDYPGYGFARHKGYPTKMHLEALRRQGISPVHRRSFGPIRALAEGGIDSHLSDVDATVQRGPDGTD